MNRKSKVRFAHVEFIDRMLREKRSLDEILGYILDTACITLTIPKGLGIIAVYNSENIPIMRRWNDDEFNAFQAIASLEGGAIGHAIQQKRHDYLPNLRRHRPPYYRAYKDDPRIVCELAVPIIARNEGVGIINLEHIKAKAFSSEDIQWVSLLAAKAAQAYEADRALRTQKEPIGDARLATLVTKATDQFRQRLDILFPQVACTNLLKMVLDITISDASSTEKLPVAGAALIRLDGDQLSASYAAIRTATGTIEPLQLQRESWSSHTGLTGRAIQTGKEQYMEDRRIIGATPGQLISEPWVITEIAIPINYRDNKIGALNVGIGAYDALSHTAKVALDQLMQGIALELYILQLQERVSLERTEANEALEASHHETRDFQLILSAGRNDTYNMTFRGAAADLVRIARILVPEAQEIYVHSYDKEDETFDRVASFPEPPPAAHQQLVARNSIAWRCVTKPEAQNIEDLSTDTLNNINVTPQGSEMVLYLGARNDIFGTLTFFSEEPHSFSEDRFDKAKLLALMASSTMSNKKQPTDPIALSKTLITVATNLVQDALDDRTRLLRQILDAAIKLTDSPTNYCSILLVKNNVFELGEHTARKADAREQVTPPTMPLWQGVCGAAYQRQEAIYIEDCRNPKDGIVVKKRNETDPLPGSELVVPLKRPDGTVFGVLNLEGSIPDAFRWVQQPIKQLAKLVATILLTNDQFGTLSGVVAYVAHQLGKTPLPIQKDLLSLRRQLADLQANTSDIDDLIAATHFINLGINRLESILAFAHAPRQQALMTEDIDVRERIIAVVDAYRFYVRRGENHRILKGPATGAKALVHLVAQDFDAVLAELLDNARKYSHANTTIVVNVSADDLHVQITCDSVGYRILPEERDLVFLPGFRTKASEKSDIKGTGLGLAFVKSMVDQWGGRIFIEDLPTSEEGTHVIINLPFSRFGM